MAKLLKLAKKIPQFKKRKISAKYAKYSEAELEELAVAWLMGEVSFKQINLTLRLEGSNVYNFLCTYIREAARRGTIVKK